MSQYFFALVTGLTLLCLVSCRLESEPKALSYQVLVEYPHDPGAWVQGLVFADGKLYQSTGLRGRSTLREIDLESGAIVRKVNLSDQLFGEGLTELDGRLYQLTWQAGVGLIYDMTTFEVLEQFQYHGEGWGLTHDGQHLIMSDGSSQLRFLDPGTFQVARTLQVTMDGKPLRNLNELEFIDDLIVANVWYTDKIVWIDPSSGEVLQYLNLFDLMPRRPVAEGAVLNGIAHDPDTGHLLVTGKFWPKIFRLKVQ